MRLDQLTFPRFFAAMCVVTLHFFPFPEKTFFPDRYLGELVNFFFILSGFILIISSYRNEVVSINKKNYFINRFARIYPVYFLSLVAYIASSVIVGRGNDYTPFSFLIDATLLQAWLPHYIMQHNAPSWSLSVEAFFYITFPFLAAFLLRLSSKTLVILGVAAYIISHGFKLYMYHYLGSLPQTPEMRYTFLAVLTTPIVRYHTFMIGAITGILFCRHREYLKSKYNIILSVFLVLLVSTTAFLFLRLPLTMVQYINGAFDHIFLFSILTLALSDGAISKLFSKKPLQYLGEISYSIYILQFPIGILTVGVVDKFLHLGGLATFGLVVIAIIIGSAISYRVVEFPARMFIRKKLTGEKSVPLDSVGTHQ